MEPGTLDTLQRYEAKSAFQKIDFGQEFFLGIAQAFTHK
jgi:hypothetical protein